MNGNQYSDWVANYIVYNFSDRGLTVYREVPIGKSIIGKNRRVDILLVDEAQNKAISIECKFQTINGTAEEKIPYTLNDIRAMQMDAYISYGGDGFSKGVKHMLEASELAVHAEPEDLSHVNYSRTPNTLELDQVLAMRFNWWDIFTSNKYPVKLQNELDIKAD
ncbi:PD-(D/E)XK nuclease superfamily protein [Kangiella marina]|uniref:PD-(D/E)XK nuclease domain-containing protein n=1 Tax=Kangiella marina TaxID=1079178 RepID=A0ABP8IFR5_9GAMM